MADIKTALCMTYIWVYDTSGECLKGWIVSMRPSNAIWLRSRSTFARVGACWLMPPSHYLNQRRLSFVMFCGICMWRISQRVSKLRFCIICLKMISSCQEAAEFRKHSIDGIGICLCTVYLRDHVQYSCFVVCDFFVTYRQIISIWVYDGVMMWKYFPY